MPQTAWRPPVAAWSLDGVTYRFRDVELAELVGALLVAHPLSMIFGTAANPALPQHLATRIVDPDDHITDDLLNNIADAIAQAYFGRPRWQARRLWERAMGQWPDIDGELSGRGVDLFTLPPDRATNVVYRCLLQRVRDDKPEMERFRDELSEPPQDVVLRQMRAVTAEEDDGAGAQAVGEMMMAAHG